MKDKYIYAFLKAALANLVILGLFVQDNSMFVINESKKECKDQESIETIKYHT